MRLLVVAGSPPLNSFSTAPWRRIAPQPPGPGLPRQAPSVKMSTSGSAPGALSGVDAIARRVGHVAVEAQLFQVFERVLRPHQGALGLVQPAVEPGQQEAQRAALREQR